MVKLVDSLIGGVFVTFFFFSSRRRHTRLVSDWSSDVCSSDLLAVIVVVDHDVNIHNYSEVVWKTLCALDPERDVQFSLGPVDTLDHAARMQDFGSKMGIDATRKWPSEGFARPWPDEIVMDEATKQRVDELWKTLGLG